ncbi:MAG: hypothetical protein V7768_06400, partial [Dietzia cercidiphylli]
TAFGTMPSAFTGLVEGAPLVKYVGLADPDRRTQRAVRPLLAGYLLSTLADDATYSAFADPETKLKGTVAVTDAMLEEEDDDLVAGAPPLLKLAKSFTGS